MFQRILVVCTGNICRSPIAEALLKAGLPGKMVFSAGTMAMVGDAADPVSIELCAGHGLDISTHRAQQLVQPMLQAADLVLTLDKTHNQWIQRRYPQYHGKVHKLGKWLGNEDVPDPYRQPKAVFRTVYGQMDAQVTEWLARIK